MRHLSKICVLLSSTISLGALATNVFPWERPLALLSQDLTGPTSTAIGLIGLFVAGGSLVFGGDLAAFGRKVTWMVMALSLMLSGGTFVNIISNGVALPAASSALI